MAIRYYTEDCNYKLKDKRKISAWIADTARNEGFKTGDISVILCSDAHLLSINNQYLEHNYFTDIITFDYRESLDSKTISGDLFISVDTVVDNAHEFGVAAAEEMKRIIIHGILHLCGFKDKSKKQEKLMREKEDFYLEHFPA